MPRHDGHVVHALAIALGLGALTLGSGAGAAGATNPPVVPAASAPPGETVLSDGRTLSRWAYPQAGAIVRKTPSRAARAVGRLHFLTEDGQAEIYLALRKTRMAPTGVTWIQVSVPKRPNNVTGWVAASALGTLHVVRGRLVVRRSKLRATLYNGAGRAIWSAPVGIGRPSLATPVGHFYVREKLRAIGSSMYGPFALGTSAYAPKLTDWPGGGVVGIHGTDQPQLDPRPAVARLHPPAQRRHHAPVATDLGRHAGRRRLRRSALRDDAELLRVRRAALAGRVPARSLRDDADAGVAEVGVEDVRPMVGGLHPARDDRGRGRSCIVPRAMFSPTR